MRPARLFPLLAASAALFAAPALAQQAGSVALNDQLQWGDVFASMTVTSRDGGQTGVSSVATAAGNTVSGANMTGDMNVQSTQSMTGASSAEAIIDADDACCQASAIATAQGNAAQAQTSGGNLVADINQSAAGATVDALARVSVGNTSLLQAASSAAANNAATAATNGDLAVTARQTASSGLRARTVVDACCTGLTLAGASASANALSTTSSTSTVALDVEQTSTGPSVEASTDVYQYRGYDVNAASTAAGNSITTANEWGYVALRGRQNNSSDVSADTRVTLGSWEGTASSSAYGVGNSVLATNVGSDMAVDVNQINTGGVAANASFDGGANAATNGAAVVNATAIGNGFTGYVCSYCGDAALTGKVSQSNGGNVTATGSINAYGASSLAGAASAVGNSATFITASRNN